MKTVGAKLARYGVLAGRPQCLDRGQASLLRIAGSFQRSTGTDSAGAPRAWLFESKKRSVTSIPSNSWV